MARVRTGLGPAVLATGIAGGIIGAAYLGVLHLVTRLIGPDHHGSVVQIAILVGVGLSIALLTHFLGETGDVELLVDNIHVLGGTEDVRQLRSLVPASLLCIGAGGAMGPEAPLVQTTGSAGTWLGERMRRSRNDVRILTITGMAAGFTVLFGAPLGAGVFALEILHRRGLEYYEALVPAVVGSVCGYGVYVALSGTAIAPVWQFPPVGPLHTSDLLLAVALGLVGSVGAAVFAFSARGCRWLFERMPMAAGYVAGGLALGLLALWTPYALTFGEAQLDGLADGQMTAGALAVAFFGKLAGTVVTLGARWKGGFIIPLFFLGATSGQLVHHLLPGTDQSVVMAGLMVAFCVGVTKTAIGSTLVVTQMAGLPLLAVTLIAAVVALVATAPLTVIESQRGRDPTDRPAP